MGSLQYLPNIRGGYVDGQPPVQYLSNMRGGYVDCLLGSQPPVFPF